MLKSYLAFTSAVHHVLTRAYERLGAAIARKPLLTILLSIAAISLANLGLLQLRSVGDAIALWVPGASSYHEQRRAIDAAFGSFDQALALLLPRAPHRALSADVLLEAADLHEAVAQLSVTIGAGTAAQRTYAFADLCARPLPLRPTTCFVRSPLDWWLDADLHVNRTQIADDAATGALGKKPLQRPPAFSGVGEPLDADALVGSAR